MHYFDRNYAHGPDWYAGHFTNAPAGSVVGESTPHYLYSADALERISSTNIQKFILILRDPLSRTLSHFRHRIAIDGLKCDFETFLDSYPNAVSWSSYSRWLPAWIDRFGRDGLLVVIAEEAQDSPASLAVELGRFLDVDSNGFQAQNRRNASVSPRYRWLYRVAHRAHGALLDAGMDGLAAQAKKRFGEGLRKSSAHREHAPAEIVSTELQDLFSAEKAAVEEILRRRIESWGSSGSS